jgi:hypothetical protein
MVSQLRGDEPRLELGDSGEGVRELQFRLYRLGYYRQFPDGTFDMTTENAVRELQSAAGQDNTGEVTTETWQAIVYWEQQSGLDYQFVSPADAIDQLIYDLEHPQQGEVLADGQWRWNGADWVAATETAQRAGMVSEDGQWRWTGSEWVAADAGASAGPLSDDGQWRWTGSEWVAATGGGNGASGEAGAGLLSEDGYWRWNGSEWVAA